MDSSGSSLSQAPRVPYKVLPIPVSPTPHPPANENEPDISILGKIVGVLVLLFTYLPAVTKAVVKHFVFGAPQPAWPVGTTIFTAIFRRATLGLPPPNYDVAVDELKVTLAQRRRLDLVKWLPPPTNGFSSPVSILVGKSGLSGLLAEMDEQEDSSRAIEAEWVVHNSVHRAGANASTRIVLYFHGGAYTLMNAEGHRPLTIMVSKGISGRVLAVNYRLAPEARFPRGIQDAVCSYLYLIRELKIPPQNIYISGDSAGGGISLALLLYLRDQKLPLPGGGILLSPWVDPTSSFRSNDTNAPFDYIVHNPDYRLHPMRLYLGDDYDRFLTHPYVCSCLADFTSIPPLLIQCGGAELLLDEGTLLARRATTAGVDVTFEIMEGGIHVYQAFTKTERSRAAYLAIKRWIEKQPAPGLVDFSGVDEELQAAWHDKSVKWKAKAKLDSSPSELGQSPWTFQAVSKRPPELVLRREAHELVRKAVQELRTGDINTTLYFAVRSPGLANRIRSLL